MKESALKKAIAVLIKIRFAFTGFSVTLIVITWNKSYSFQYKPEGGLYPRKGDLYPGKGALYPGKGGLHPGKGSLYQGKGDLYPGKGAYIRGRGRISGEGARKIGYMYG